MTPVTPEEYLAASYRALTRNERSTEEDSKALLLLILWRVRQSLLASLPDRGLSRPVILNALLQPVARELQDYSQQFLSILLLELEKVDVEHSRRAAEFAGLTPTLRDYRPRKGEDLLRTTRSGGRTLYDLFLPSPLTGLSPYTTAHLRALRAKILAGIMREDTTIEIARTVVAERTRAGYIQPINARGTIYSALRNRDLALISNAIWEVSGYAERAIFERQAYLTRRPNAPEGTTPFAANGWQWNAVLDPATCPICRPLHLTTSDRFTGFPYIPPVHPRCRCRILPNPM